jgi:hypothetical protein
MRRPRAAPAPGEDSGLPPQNRLALALVVSDPVSGGLYTSDWVPVMREHTIPTRATYEDYRQIPDDGKRYEILDGAIFMTPSPSPEHQYVSKRLQRMLEAYFEERHGYVVL